MKQKNKYDRYKKNQDEKNKQNRIFTAAVIFIIVAMLGAQGITCRERIGLKRQKKHIEYQIAKEKKRTQKLKRKEQKQKTTKFVEETAREKFHMIYPDEYLLKEK